MTDHESQTAVVPTTSKSRVGLLLLLLNLILVGGLLYKTFVKTVSSSGGLMLALYNDLPSAITDVNFEYPGGKFSFPELQAHGQIGTPLNYGSDFKATLSFTDEDGKPHKESFKIRLQGDLLVLVFIEPVLEESVLKTSEGKEETVLKASPTRVRIITALQAPNSDI